MEYEIIEGVFVLISIAVGIGFVIQIFRLLNAVINFLNRH